MKHWFPLFMLLGIVACNGEIYLRDGVTDGDTFYLANRTLADSDPALQSWASYSLTAAPASSRSAAATRRGPVRSTAS